jgi:hypothetical protein
MSTNGLAYERAYQEAHQERIKAQKAARFQARKYGAWQEEIALFDKQLSMFEPGLGTAPTEGEQKVVPFARPEKDTATELEVCPFAGCTKPAEHRGKHDPLEEDQPEA